MTSSPWTGRSHPELAELARELLLAGHLIDRAGMPHLIGRFGREVMGEVAIEEWANASPIYARRMQRLLGFEGDTVETIFKGMQLALGHPRSSWTSATQSTTTTTASSTSPTAVR